MALPPGNQPIYEAGVTTSLLPNGLIQIEIIRSADNDWAYVGGLDRLKQDVTLFSMRKQGIYPWNPDIGNALLNYVGQPFDNPQMAATIYLDSLNGQFMTLQQIQYMQGFISLDSMASSFSVPKVSLNFGVLTMDVTVTSMTGQSAPISTSIQT